MTNLPKFKKIASDLEEMIMSGELAPGDQLPTMVTLATQYGVSYVTIREATLLLKVKGLVEGRQGKGMFVTKEDEDDDTMAA